MLKEFRDNLMQTFEMTNLGSLHYFPGLGVQQLEGRVLIYAILKSY